MARPWEAEANAADAAAAFSFTGNHHGPSSDLRRVFDAFTFQSRGSLAGMPGGISDTGLSDTGLALQQSLAADARERVAQEIASATFVLGDERASFGSFESEAHSARKRSSERLQKKDVPPVKRSREFDFKHREELTLHQERHHGNNGNNMRHRKHSIVHHSKRSSENTLDVSTNMQGGQQNVERLDKEHTAVQRKSEEKQLRTDREHQRKDHPPSAQKTKRRHHKQPLDIDPSEPLAHNEQHASASSELGRRYSLGGFLGEGSFAVVRKAFDQVAHERVAIKCVYTSKAATNSSVLQREIEAGKTLHHENIVRFREVCYGRAFTFLVFDMVSGVDLLTFISANDTFNVPEVDAHRIFTQAMSALAYCHQKNIAHRDIKLENIMVDSSNNLKTTLLDFGLCLPHGTPEKRFTSEFCGSADYCAPEILLCHDDYDAHASDIWAIGVVLFTLIFGTLPFNRERRNHQIIHNKVHPAANFPSITSFPHISMGVRSLLVRMLQLDAPTRITAEAVLAHRWFVHSS